MVRIELWRAGDVITMRAVNFSIRELVSGKVSVEKSDLSVFGTEDEGIRVRTAPRVLGVRGRAAIYGRRVEIVFYEGFRPGP